jgi:hypothetical protein
MQENVSFMVNASTGMVWPSIITCNALFIFVGMPAALASPLPEPTGKIPKRTGQEAKA